MQVFTCVMLIIPFRGGSFHPEYQMLSVLRSLLQPTVPFMAMTATASAQTKNVIMYSLHMHQSLTAIVDTSPDKDNIFYGVLDRTTTEELALALAAEIMKFGLNYTKTLVFCRK